MDKGLIIIEPIQNFTMQHGYTTAEIISFYPLSEEANKDNNKQMNKSNLPTSLLP